MNPTLVLVALIVSAFVVSRFLHRHAERVSLVSGIEYAVVGVLIGPLMPFGLIAENTLETLDLLVTLLLGLLGFLVGLHARVALRRFEHFLAGSVAGLLVALAVGVVTLALMQGLDPAYADDPAPMFAFPIWTDASGGVYELWASEHAVWLALTLGAAAASASSTAIESAAERYRAEGRPVVLLRDLASAGQVMAILLFGFALAGGRAEEAASDYGLSLVEWAGLTGLTGALTGLLFTIFIGGTEDDVRLLLATLGVVLFASGLGTALGVSPLFVNLVAGLTVAATSAHADRLRDNLDQLKRPAAILLLVFAGIAWRPVLGWLWLVPAAYLLTRVGTWMLASRFAVTTFVHGAEFRRVGGGLIGQGSLAAAIALSYAQVYPDHGAAVLTAVLVPMLITDLFAVSTLRSVLANAGAIRPRADVRAEPEAAQPEEQPP